MLFSKTGKFVDWLNKNANSLEVVGGAAAALCTMTYFIISSIHSVEIRTNVRMDEKFEKMDTRLAQLEKDVTIIKTVLSMDRHKEYAYNQPK